VGQELTKPNPNLRSERATGWETGVVWMTRYNTYLRASYFWTQVNRPITALTVSTTPTLITEVRENLGQIESKGISLDAETAPGAHWLSLIGGYQYANATVTKFSQQAVTVACGHPTHDAHRLPDSPGPSATWEPCRRGSAIRRSAC
jgi:outer membrane receptor protein involved in Fe transport